MYDCSCIISVYGCRCILGYHAKHEGGWKICKGGGYDDKGCVKRSRVKQLLLLIQYKLVQLKTHIKKLHPRYTRWPTRHNFDCGTHHTAKFANRNPFFGGPCFAVTWSFLYSVACEWITSKRRYHCRFTATVGPNGPSLLWTDDTSAYCCKIMGLYIFVFINSRIIVI